MGQVAVVENHGSLLDDRRLDGTAAFYELPTLTGGISVADLNGDDDLDLVIATGAGLVAYLGVDGMGFQRSEDLVAATPELPVSAARQARGRGRSLSPRRTLVP